MAKRASLRTRYRDSQTGRFVKKSTWRRSRAHGGTRYRRTRVRTGPRSTLKKAGRQRRAMRTAAPPRPKREGEVREWIVTFSYRKSGRSFDVISVARFESAALETAKDFLAEDANGKKVVQAAFSGWDTAIARAKRTSRKVGTAEYRADSEEEENGEEE